MALVRQLLAFVFGGALAGVLASSYVGPRFLTWYNSPGGSSGPLAQCHCGELTRQVAAELISLQLKGALGGACAGLVLGVVFVLWRRKRAAASRPTAANATP